MRHGHLTATLLLPLWALGLMGLCAAHQPPQGQSANAEARREREYNPAMRLRGRSPAATRLAHERFQMLQSIESVIPELCLGSSATCNDSLLFPIGRSDRAYILHGSDWALFRVYCYQRTGRGIKLVYRVDLNRRTQFPNENRPATGAVHVASLLRYIEVWEGVSAHTCRPGRSISRAALSDLASKREYVEYYPDVISTLHVSLFLAGLNDRHYRGEEYFMAYEYSRAHPNRDVGAGVDQFYRTYGLPAAKAELPLLRWSVLQLDDGSPRYRRSRSCADRRYRKVMIQLSSPEETGYASIALPEVAGGASCERCAAYAPAPQSGNASADTSITSVTISVRT